MYFGTKSYLKSNRYHTAKHSLTICAHACGWSSFYGFLKIFLFIIFKNIYLVKVIARWIFVYKINKKLFFINKK
jgi:hypothetical protein